MTLERSEVLDRYGNCVDNIAGLNKDQTYHYVLSGDPSGECWEPLFTFRGFRYVRLTGYPGDPTAEQFRAVVLAGTPINTSASTAQMRQFRPAAVG